MGYFKELALSLGLDPVALLRAAGISPRHLVDNELTLPMPKLAELIESAARSSGIEDFGLRLAEVCGLPELGPVGLLMREEPTVRDALQVMIDLGRLISDPETASTLLTYLEEGDNATYRIDVIRNNPAFSRQTIDLYLGSAVYMMRSLLGENWMPVSVGFAHSRPRPRRRFDRFFRCPVYFDHEFNGIVLRQRDLNTRKPSISAALRWQTDLFLQAIDVIPGDVFIHRVTRMIAVALPTGQATAERTARSLGIDRRTLSRRLERMRLDYSTLLARIRKNLAIQHIAGSDRPLAEIASILGFRSLSTFSRWFHHSFGCSPSAWRRAQRAAPNVVTRFVPQLAK